MAPVMRMIDGRSLVNEDPTIVFSVKELISRLDGKLDMLMSALTSKADKTELDALAERVVKVEDAIQAMNAVREALVRARGDHVNTTRWRITALIAGGAALVALAAFVTTLVLRG